MELLLLFYRNNILHCTLELREPLQLEYNAFIVLGGVKVLHTPCIYTLHAYYTNNYNLVQLRATPLHIDATSDNIIKHV